MFAGSFAVLFVLMTAWAIASPLMSAPDEPVHVIKAAAVVRGQLTGTEDRSGRYPVTHVQVPEIFALGDTAACYRFHDDIPASCAPSMSGSTHDVQATTTAGTYPPFYYAIVGLPSLVLVSQRGVYAMRIVSAALCALLLACGFQAIIESRRRHLFLAGALVATTPVAVYFGGVVNPTGMEIASSIALWTSLLVALDDPPADARGRAFLRVGITGVALAVTRPISPFWVVVIAVFCALAVGVDPIREWLRDRRGIVTAAVVGVAGVFTTVWTVGMGTLDQMIPGYVTGYSTLGNIWFGLGLTGSLYDQLIGVFGWIDTTVPLAVFLVTVALGAVGLAATAVGRRRDIVLLVSLVLLTVVFPIAIEVPTANTRGFLWMGRYLLPLAAGVPIVAGFIADRGAPALHWLRARALASVAVLVAIAQVCAFSWALRRYRVGRSSMNFLTNGSWTPPVHPIILCVAVVAALAVGVRWTITVTREVGGDAAAPGACIDTDAAAAETVPLAGT